MIDAHPTQFNGITPTPAWALAQYQRIRATLPPGLPATRQPDTRQLDSLEPLTDRFRAFVFDAFGVLNAGPRAFPAAVQHLRDLQDRGKPVLVLSNAATASHPALVIKYQAMGFTLEPEQIISSRWVLEQTLHREQWRGRYGVIAPASSAPDSLHLDWVPVRSGISASQLDELDGFVFLSTEGWNETIHQALTRSLCHRPRPLCVANPDLVAPRGDCLTLEPGYFAQLLREQCGLQPTYFGKPYQPAFEAVRHKLPGIEPDEILMVGDTLHTDILGGQQAGFKTLLVTAEGALRGLDIPDCIAQSGISPDYTAPAI